MAKHDEEQQRTDGGDVVRRDANKVPKGMKRYRIGRENYYREGVLYPAGTLVDIPADEEPSMTWFEAETGRAVSKKGTRTGVGTGAQGTRQLAENPNPMPETPANAFSIAGTTQPIPPDAKPVPTDDDKGAPKKK
jgi:hypothetical protein